MRQGTRVAFARKTTPTERPPSNQGGLHGTVREIFTKVVSGIGQNGMSSSEISADWEYSSCPPAAAGLRWSKLAAEPLELAAR